MVLGHRRARQRIHRGHHTARLDHGLVDRVRRTHLLPSVFDDVPIGATPSHPRMPQTHALLRQNLPAASVRDITRPALCTVEYGAAGPRDEEWGASAVE